MAPPRAATPPNLTGGTYLRFSALSLPTHSPTPLRHASFIHKVWVGGQGDIGDKETRGQGGKGTRGQGVVSSVGCFAVE